MLSTTTPRDTRSLTSAELYDLRKRAVTAVQSGKKIIHVAATLGISRQAVARWVAVSNESNENGLKPRQKGRPKGGVLKERQAKRVITYIVKRLPDQLKLPFFLWTREAIALLIKRLYNIRLSVWTIGRLLQRWGLTPQRPAKRAYERDPKTVDEWIKKEYPKIRALARRENAIVLWEDEMGIRSDAAVERTYGLRGKTPLIPVSGKRFRCNMIAGISNRGKLFFMVFKENFTALVFMSFLRRLLCQLKKKVFLIADAHPAHRAHRTQRWLKKNKQKVRLFFLPPYCPDLNPSEYLNQDVKTNAVRRKRPENQTQMIASVRKYLRSKQRRPNKVRSYFRAKSVRYAAL